MSIAESSGPPKVSFLYDPKVRSIAYQIGLVAVIVFLAYSAVRNAIDNLARAKIASGFGFWNQTAGFDISQTLIEYTAQGGTYGRAFWVGLLNTLGQVMFPELAYFVIFGPMALLLAFRPLGLFGRAA